MSTRFAPAAVLALATTAVLTGSAHASTVYHAGPLAYDCKFPDTSLQRVTLVQQFTGPDTVAPGATFRISDVSGRVTLSPAAHANLAAGGSDGLDSGFTAAFVEAANAPRSSTVSATDVPAMWGPDPVVIDFGGGRQVHKAAASGTVTFHADRLALILSLHRPDGAPSGPTVVCTPASGQNTGFAPTMPIG
ncbi:hypothetical protein OHS18_40115 [Amycolatopsis sp. NBC_00355]|uniref:DUF6801 domain-containing protein n=1 Tax=Amycolatopsis sp. NBC_00355 TaxID=2975957 RepID=UPI002E26EDE1